MTVWLVAEYDQVDVSRMQDLDKVTAPGEISAVHMVGSATTADQAILRINRAGWFSAVEAPQMPKPRQVSMSIEIEE